MVVDSAAASRFVKAALGAPSSEGMETDDVVVEDDNGMDVDEEVESATKHPAAKAIASASTKATVAKFSTAGKIPRRSEPGFAETVSPSRKRPGK